MSTERNGCKLKKKNCLLHHKHGYLHTNMLKVRINHNSKPPCFCFVLNNLIKAKLYHRLQYMLQCYKVTTHCYNETTLSVALVYFVMFHGGAYVVELRHLVLVSGQRELVAA